MVSSQSLSSSHGVGATPPLSFGRRLAQFGARLFIHKTYGQDAKGLNAAVLANIAFNGSAKGLNVAYFFNATSKDQSGVNLALFNLCDRNQWGVSLGVINGVVEDQRGLNIAAFLNGADGDQIGINIAGVGNGIRGDQIGLSVGAINNVTGDQKGVSFSALWSDVLGSVYGLSAGLTVFTRQLKGVMVGLFTAVDTSKDSKGVQIGLLNVRLDEENWYNRYRPFFAVNWGRKDGS